MNAYHPSWKTGTPSQRRRAAMRSALEAYETVKQHKHLSDKEREQREMLNQRLGHRIKQPVDLTECGAPYFGETVPTKTSGVIDE